MYLLSNNRLPRAGILSASFVCRTLLLLLVLPLGVFAQERIHFGDVVDVDVVGSFDNDWRGGLTPDGFLDGLEKLSNPVPALCRTESEVAASIREQYGRILRDPVVVVRIVDRSNRALAYINGAVRTPQRLQLRRALSLTELIVFAGGITDSSSGEISIFRPPNVNCRAESSSDPNAEQAPKRISVKIADLLGGVKEANPTILTGDIVTVIEAPPVFVTGGVAAPRRLNLTPDLTLARAIAAAGGIPDGGSGRKARIYRRQSDTTVLEYDIRSIRQGKAEDPKLLPYDVIDVEERGRPSRKPAPIVEARDRSKEILTKLPLRIVD